MQTKAREAIAPFTELVKSPEHVHTYRLTPLSIWNARAAGLAADKMVSALHEHSRYPVPDNVDQTVLDLAGALWARRHHPRRWDVAMHLRG